jgi:hypothetical protein
MSITAFAGRALRRSAAIGFVLAASCTDTENERSLTEPVTPVAAEVVSAYDILKMNGPVTLDGNLSEWAGIPAITFQDDPGNGRGALNNTVAARMAWDATYLYVAYDVSDTELLASQTARDAADLYKDDEVELFLDPQGDGGTWMQSTDYQLQANLRDAVRDANGDGAGGKLAGFNAASLQSKAALNGTLNGGSADVGYTIELRVAWSDLGVTAPAGGKLMRLDLAVGDKDATTQPVESFDWAALTATYNNPNGWRDVQLVDTPPIVPVYDIVKVAPSTLTLDGSLSDWAGVSAIPTFADDPARGAAANSASVRMAWDDTYLYAAYTMTDTELWAAETTRDAANLYRDDEVELFLDPQGDGGTSMKATDYQLQANLRDAVRDANGDGAGGKLAGFNAPSLQAKAALNGSLNGGSADVGYTIELRVAWSDLGVTAPAGGKLMRLDLAAGDKDVLNQPAVESFDWAALAVTYNNPNGWKGVRLVVDATAPSAPTSPAVAVVSSTALTFSWTPSTSPDAARYRVYRGTSGSPTLLATVPAGPFNDTGLTPGTSYTYQVAAVDPSGNESPRTASVTASTTGGGGVPYGPFALWANATSVKYGPAPFTVSGNFTDPSTVVTQINAARSMSPKQKLVLAMTGGAHSTYLTNGNFDLNKWKARMDAFNTTAIKNAVQGGVADGTIVGNLLMDEPEHSSWGIGVTKAVVDQMADYVHAIFPTLPVGPAHGPGAYKNWRPTEHYTKVDYVVNQYNWWITSGNVAAWRDAVRAQYAPDGVRFAWSLNLLDGGVQDTDGAVDCPWSQPGTFGPNCWMTAAQVRDWGRILGVDGCLMLMWEYRDNFFNQDDNEVAFAQVAATVAGVQPPSCKRPT